MNHITHPAVCPKTNLPCQIEWCTTELCSINRSEEASTVASKSGYYTRDQMESAWNAGFSNCNMSIACHGSGESPFPDRATFINSLPAAMHQYAPPSPGWIKASEPGDGWNTIDKLPDYDNLVLWWPEDGIAFTDMLDKDGLPDWLLKGKENGAKITHWRQIKGPDDDKYDLDKLYDWLMDENRRPAITAFTSGIARNIAREVEFRLRRS